MASLPNLDDDYDFGGDLTGTNSTRRSGNKRRFEDLEEGDDDIFGVIAGIAEHRILDQFSDQALLVNMLSFVTRTINSYWGTQESYYGDLTKCEQSFDRRGRTAQEGMAP